MRQPDNPNIVIWHHAAGRYSKVTGWYCRDFWDNVVGPFVWRLQALDHAKATYPPQYRKHIKGDQYSLESVFGK